MPDESFENARVSRKSSIAVFFLLLVAVVGVAFFVYLQSRDIDIRNMNAGEILGNIFLVSKEGDAADVIREIDYDSREKAVFCSYKDYLVKCTADSIRWIDRKGDEVRSVDHTMNRPLVRASGSFLLAADIGGREINVFKGTEPRWHFIAESDIINADINEDGYVTVVQDVMGYKARVSVYDPQLDEPLIFTRTIAECFVLSAKLLPSSRQLLINKIDATGIRTNTYLEFSDLSSEEPFSSVFRENALYPAVWFMNDGSTFAAGDSKLIYLDAEGKPVWEKDYEKGMIFSSDVCLGKYPVAAVADNALENTANGGTSVNVFNAKGDVISSSPLEGEVRNIKAFSDRIAVNLGREILFINTRGKIIGRFAAKSEVSGVYFFNKREAAVIAKNSISIINID